jgi:hypothetical protein
MIIIYRYHVIFLAVAIVYYIELNTILNFEAEASLNVTITKINWLMLFNPLKPKLV